MKLVFLTIDLHSYMSSVEAGPSHRRKRRLFGVFGKVRNNFLIMFLYYQICAT